jgi:hypothetical protein
MESVESAIEDDLRHQANSATRGHAEAVGDITANQARQIVAFQRGLITAQTYDNQAGMLNAEGAQGGPAALSTQEFFIGINDPVGFNGSVPFSPFVFTLFDAWSSMPSPQRGPIVDAREAIARGHPVQHGPEGAGEGGPRRIPSLAVGGTSAIERFVAISVLTRDLRTSRSC